MKIETEKGTVELKDFTAYQVEQIQHDLGIDLRPYTRATFVTKLAQYLGVSEVQAAVMVLTREADFNPHF